jgi:hypothetical protein
MCDCDVDSVIDLTKPWPTFMKVDCINVILPAYATLFQERKMQS